MRSILEARHWGIWSISGLLLVSACGPSAPATGGDPAGPPITVKSALARRVPASDRGVLYLTVHNRGRLDDWLETIETPAATAELHETVDNEGVLSMVHHPDGFEVPAGGLLELRPGGRHVMLLGLSETDESLPLELHFRNAGKIVVETELLSAEAQL